MTSSLPSSPSSPLDLLLQRRSHPHLTAPGPSDAEIALMLEAALRVPDFQHLRPYRFLLARQDGLARLGEAMRMAAIRAGKPPKMIERAPRMPHRAPLVIVAVASPKPSQVVPISDQLLCAGCTVLTLQLAAQAMGYGSIWRTGWLATAPDLHAQLGIAGHETIIGFLYVGMPDETPPVRNDPSGQVSREHIPEGVAAWL